MKMNGISLAALLLSTSFASGGPFGLSKGMKIEDLPAGLTETSEQVYRTKNVPTPSSMMQGYTLIFGKTLGLAKIACNTPNVNTSAYGEGVITELRKIESALTMKYGKPSDKFDFLNEGSIWKQPRYWTMSLFKGERVLASAWSKTKGDKLPDNLQSIGIKAVSVDSVDPEKIFILVTYEFDNFKEVSAELLAKKAEGL